MSLADQANFQIASNTQHDNTIERGPIAALAESLLGGRDVEESRHRRDETSTTD